MEDVHPLYDDDDESDAENHHPMDHFMQNIADIANPFMAMGGMGVGPFAMMGPHFVGPPGGGGIPFAPFNFDVDVDSDDAGLDEMMPMQMFHQVDGLVYNAGETHQQTHDRWCREKGPGCWVHGFELLYGSPDDPTTALREPRFQGHVADRNNIDSSKVRFVAFPKRHLLRHFTDANWKRMARDIQTYSNLTDIDISHCGAAAGPVVATLFAGDRAAGLAKLKVLDFAHTDVGVGGMTSLLSFFRSRPEQTICDLNLEKAGINSPGLDVLAEILNVSKIGSLSLSQNSFDGEALDRLLSARNARHLVSIELDKCPRLDDAGYDSLCRLLGRTDTKLSELYVSPTISHAKTLVESVSKGSKLETLGMWTKRRPPHEQMRHIRTELAPLLKKSVCNINSFKDLCNSNHCLVSFGKESLYSSGVDFLATSRSLRINNRKCSEVKRIRSKLRSFYFKRADYDISPFANMEVNLMPHVLELVTRSEVWSAQSQRARVPRPMDRGQSKVEDRYFEGPGDDLGVVFRLVRNVHIPEMYGFARSHEISEVEKLESENRELKKQVSELKRELAMYRDEEASQHPVAKRSRLASSS